MSRFFKKSKKDGHKEQSSGTTEISRSIYRKPKKVLYRTLVSEKVEDQMGVLGLTIQDLADALDVTYESARQYAKGVQLLTPSRVEELAEVLKLDYDELWALAVRDDMQKRYGDDVLRFFGKNPELGPIERVWPRLSDDHKKDLITMVEAFAQRDKEN